MTEELSLRQHPKAEIILQAGIAEFAAHAYADANTDRITSACGISKGLLYHYFGTKKRFYLACMRQALDTLTQATAPPPEGDFYRTIFTGMERKIHLCLEHPMETKLLNMASREASQEVRAEKDALLGQYAAQIRAHSAQVMATAVSALPQKRVDAALATHGLTLYVNALVNQYLVLYQEAPEQFFLRKDQITRELKASIDLMLYGVCKEKNV